MGLPPTNSLVPHCLGDEVRIISWKPQAPGTRSLHLFSFHHSWACEGLESLFEVANSGNISVCHGNCEVTIFSCPSSVTLGSICGADAMSGSHSSNCMLHKTSKTPLGEKTNAFPYPNLEPICPSQVTCPLPVPSPMITGALPSFLSCHRRTGKQVRHFSQWNWMS